jgi:hypothetical protein
MAKMRVIAPEMQRMKEEFQLPVATKYLLAAKD